jgi:hypothetical protein
MKVVYYSQEDPRWRNRPYTIDGDAYETIGTSGCGPTSFAMAASTFLGKEILPTETCQYAIKNGFRTANNGTAWNYFASVSKSYGLQSVQTGNLEAAKSALREGNLVISSMGKGHFTGGGHFILLVGIPKVGWIDVYDPNHDNSKYGVDGLIDQGTRNDGKVTARESVFKAEAKQYWIISNPKKESEIEMTEAEKTAFNKLEARVEQLEKENQRVSAPKWFVKEFGSADLGGKISEPEFSAEGWRTLAVGLRVGKK